jgi:dTDP-4-dehydrorhamnose reductase
MTRVLILGTTGMLGHTLVTYFNQQGIEVVEANRSDSPVISGNSHIRFDVLKNKIEDLFEGQPSFDYCINAVGVIRQLIQENDLQSNHEAMIINRDFSQELASASESLKIRTIQIATDCVFSGSQGNYFETSPHSPTDVYGRSKSEGEKLSEDLMHIRCSIIGRELNSQNSLMDWLLSQPQNSSVRGFINHLWNGVTTLHFSQIISGVIKSGAYKPGKLHLVPSDIVSKFELINLISSEFGRSDLQISQFEAKTPVNRSLITINPERNLQLWRQGGYNEIPTISEMVSTYAKWSQKGELNTQMETI